ncbi:MAG: NAD-dependent epimerase/dehydratase family protein [Victivallales bacterium]|nr:NAD-dependent epimerase/dehydratase family protein [Victivallales bacterium]
MRILVTGGAGFIGSHIVSLLQGRGEIRVLDNLRTGSLDNLAGTEAEFIEGDVRDADCVARAMAGTDYVFHLAGMVSVPESIDNPRECFELNTIGTANVLEAAAAAGVKKLCFSYSIAVYGDNPESPKRENMGLFPQCPYAMSKLDGESCCQVFTSYRGLPTACLRYFNVFGPRQNPASGYAAAIPAFITAALSGDDLTIYGDGLQTRDFVYVKDVAAANIHFALESDATGIFNIAGGEARTILDVARQIVESAGSPSRIRFQPPRQGDIIHSLADITKAAEAGFTPKYTFPQALAETIDFFRTKNA